MLQASRLKVIEGQLATIAGKSAGEKFAAHPKRSPSTTLLSASRPVVITGPG